MSEQTMYSLAFDFIDSAPEKTVKAEDWEAHIRAHGHSARAAKLAWGVRTFLGYEVKVEKTGRKAVRYALGGYLTDAKGQPVPRENFGTPEDPRKEERRRTRRNPRLRSAGSVASKPESSSATETLWSPERRQVLTIGPAGRIAIPAQFRAKMEVAEGDRIVALLDEDGEVQLLSPKAGLRKAQAMVRKYVPEDVSLVDDLIAERRREAEAERGDG